MKPLAFPRVSRHASGFVKSPEKSPRYLAMLSRLLLSLLLCGASALYEEEEHVTHFASASEFEKHVGGPASGFVSKGDGVGKVLWVMDVFRVCCVGGGRVRVVGVEG